MIHLDTLESILSLYPVDIEGLVHDRSLSGVETRHIFNILESVKWNRTRAAEILKISLPTLRKKILKYHLSPPEK
jgi:two-component system response regulator AtoC